VLFILVWQGTFRGLGRAPAVECVYLDPAGASKSVSLIPLGMVFG